MKNRKNGFFFLLIFILIVSCGNREQRKKSIMVESDKSETIVGLSMDTLVVDRWRKDLEALEREFKLRNMVLLVRDGRNSAEIQKKQILELVEQNIDILIVIPHDSSAASDAVLPAQKRGIPIISYDRLIEKAGSDAYISFDNRNVGRLIMRELLHRVPEGRYIILNGAPKDHNSYMLREGVDDAIKTHSNKHSITILSEIWTEAWSADFAYSHIYDLLSHGENFDAVFAANDSLAGSAVRALSEFQKAGQVAVGGQDADLDACQRIVEGTQIMTVYKPIDLLAEKTADLVESLLGNSNHIIPDEMISDGTCNIPYYKIPVRKVDKGTINSIIIASGYHSGKQIYQNIQTNENR
ncbi:MAG: hypothetical protein B6241_15300 [Spirochaetaceae bacterium 4572_59]|nr:MAG: hypothetical protein B6241_15300 [Spirochaetaceae bacterium 4572_59]